MLRVVNLKDYVAVEGEVLVKVDRSSVLGNPFRMRDMTQCERDRVCDAYVNYFNRKVKEKGAFRAEVVRIYRLVRDGKDVALGCWCAPKRCHAEYIKAFIEKHLPSPDVCQPGHSADKNTAFIKAESKGSASQFTTLKSDAGVIVQFRVNPANPDSTTIIRMKPVDNTDCNAPLEYISESKEVSTKSARIHYSRLSQCCGFYNPDKASK